MKLMRLESGKGKMRGRYSSLSEGTLWGHVTVRRHVAL